MYTMTTSEANNTMRGNIVDTVNDTRENMTDIYDQRDTTIQIDHKLNLMYSCIYRFLCLRTEGAGGIMFPGCPSVHPSVRPSGFPSGSPSGFFSFTR